MVAVGSKSECLSQRKNEVVLEGLCCDSGLRWILNYHLWQRVPVSLSSDEEIDVSVVLNQ